MYQKLATTARLSQGDIIDRCPIIFWECSAANESAERRGCELEVRALVLTQTCDLENSKTTRVQVALVHETKALIDRGILSAAQIRDNVRLHRVFGWYFLEQSEHLPESIVDLRDIHTLPRRILDDLVVGGQRRCTLSSPYREHLAQHFAVTFSRIALPQPARTTE